MNESQFSVTGEAMASPRKFRLWRKNRPARKGRGGRPAKTDTASHCIMVRFNDTEHARFLTMYEQSGLLSKAAFIKARVFGDVFRVIKTDRGTLKHVAKLTQLHAQYRAIGVNYNQVVKELRTRFTERKTLSLLYKLGKSHHATRRNQPANHCTFRRVQREMVIRLVHFVFRGLHVRIRCKRACFALSIHGVGLLRSFMSQNVRERFVSSRVLKTLAI